MQKSSVDLTNCDREPIHVPGSIQPHGCLLACDAELATVRRHSGNAADMLGFAGQGLLGATVEAILGPKPVHDLRNALVISTSPARPGLLMSVTIASGRTFDVAVHAHAGNVIVELEPTGGDGRDALTPVRSLIARLRHLTSAADLLRQTPRFLRALLEYDRVMIYQFAHDSAGQVVAETKRQDLESFLGQYFPATDIPRQARDLYLKNTIRIISDSACPFVPIEPVLDASGEPLDLSFAHLRSVSPVHCEYLRNMGVGASMSISVIVGGELWGLIACHHYAPRALTMPQRIAAEMFGEFFSLHLQSVIQQVKLESATAARRALDSLLRDVAHHDNIEALLREKLPSLASLMPCDGVGLWLNGVWGGHGVTPPQSAIPQLARFVGSASDGRVWATHELSAAAPEAASYRADVSGLLAVPLSQLPRDFLFFFRKEVVHTLEWGGNPNKTYQTGPLGDRLTPRKSFAIWKETVQRQSKPWTVSDREIAEAARTALLEVIMRQTELLAAERRKADVRQKILNEELNHRVKNILALIKSVVSQPVGTRSVDEYVKALKGRIMALAVAHDQVVRHDGGGSLRRLLEAELTPYSGGAAQMALDGPEIGLDARAYSVMALVFHELSTNAAKYGALGARGGRLSVSWSMSPDGDCRIHWLEAGGPPVSAPSHKGFGTVLVDRSVPFDLGGESELRFESTGVSATFVVPARFVTALAPVAAAATREGARPDLEIPTLSDLDVLVVEDQLVIAMDVENVLSDHGARAVHTAATASEALRIVASKNIDVAVLDVNLGVGTSIPVAEELVRRGVPFIFATGYGDTAMIPGGMRAVPVVRKPHEAQSLVGAVARVVPKA